MIPTVIPVLSISFCLTSPVEKAIALGGVEMGRHMALDSARAIPMMTVVVPPMAAEPERRVPWGGGSSGSTVGRDDFHIKYFVYIKKKENKRRKIC